MKYIFFLFLLIFCQKTFGQQAKFDDNEGSFLRFIGKHIAITPELQKSDQSSGHYAIAKFAVSSEGTIDSVYIHGSTSELFSTEIKKVIKSSEKYWEPAKRNGKAIKSSFYVLPIILRYPDRKNFGEVMAKADNYIKYKSYLSEHPQCEKSKDCTILETITIEKYDRPLY